VKITLIGCGMMGQGTAYALAQADDGVDLTLMDADDQRAASTASRVTEMGAQARVSSDLEASLDTADAVSLALPWPATRKILEQVVKRGTPVASIARPHSDDIPGLVAMTKPAQVPVLLPVGLEPGLTEILTIYLARKLDQVREVRTYCGCVPRQPRGPLGYTILFGGDVVHIAQGDVYMAKAGRLVTLPRYSGVEEIFIDGVGMLEAHHDGMVPWLTEHPLLRDADCSQKTVRWPGFADRVNLLAAAGLLDQRPLDVDGVSVVPKRVLDRCLAPWVAPRPGDRDVGILDISVQGMLSGRQTTAQALVIDYSDPVPSLSAMARLTGITLATCTKMLASGSVPHAGWAQPHHALSPVLVQQLLDQLRHHGVRIEVAVRQDRAQDIDHLAPANPGSGDTI
jgi:saccharopine dehydrogenase-like NADP-dependent oxidoreductase